MSFGKWPENLDAQSADSDFVENGKYFCTGRGAMCAEDAQVTLG